MATHDRGFASMDPNKQREIARKGGIAAHEWSPTEAREAGRKGGIASHRKRAEDASAAEIETPPVNEIDGFSIEG